MPLAPYPRALTPPMNDCAAVLAGLSAYAASAEQRLRQSGDCLEEADTLRVIELALAQFKSRVSDAVAVIEASPEFHTALAARREEGCQP